MICYVLVRLFRWCSGWKVSVMVVKNDMKLFIVCLFDIILVLFNNRMFMKFSLVIILISVGMVVLMVDILIWFMWICLMIWLKWLV